MLKEDSLVRRIWDFSKKKIIVPAGVITFLATSPGIIKAEGFATNPRDGLHFSSQIKAPVDRRLENDADIIAAKTEGEGYSTSKDVIKPRVVKPRVVKPRVVKPRVVKSRVVKPKTLRTEVVKELPVDKSGTKPTPVGNSGDAVVKVATQPNPRNKSPHSQTSLSNNNIFTYPVNFNSTFDKVELLKNGLVKVTYDNNPNLVEVYSFKDFMAEEISKFNRTKFKSKKNYGGLVTLLENGQVKGRDEFLKLYANFLGRDGITKEEILDSANLADVVGFYTFLSQEIKRHISQDGTFSYTQEDYEKLDKMYEKLASKASALERFGDYFSFTGAISMIVKGITHDRTNNTTRHELLNTAPNALRVKNYLKQQGIKYGEPLTEEQLVGLSNLFIQNTRSSFQTYEGILKLWEDF